MKILYQLAPYIKQASTQSQWHAMVCIDPDWSAGPSARIALPQALTGRKALLPSAGLRWGGLIWHHISSLWYRGNTLRQSSSHGRGRDRTSKTHKVSEGLSRVETNNVSLPPHSIGENKSHGKHWPGWDHHMVWMKGVRNQG